MTITYNPSTNFGQKDALPVNDPDKVIYGAEFTTEFNAIQTAFSTAAPTNSPTFTGTATFADVDINGSTVTIGSETISDTLIANWNTAYGWGNHADAGYTTTDTTYTGGDNITLDGTTFNLDTALTNMVSADFSGTVSAGGDSYMGAGTVNGNAGAAFGCRDGFLGLNNSFQFFQPSVNDQLSLGSPAYNFKDGHFSGSIASNGGKIYAINSGAYCELDALTANPRIKTHSGSGVTSFIDASTGDAQFNGNVDANTVSIGNFNVTLSGSSLRIDHNGTALFRIDTSGNVVAKGNITAYGTPS